MSSTNSTDDSALLTTANLNGCKSFSCVLCAQRKVKCDKLPRGCTNCSKARAACIYKAPPPPRRKKKGVRELDTIAKLKLYEDALRKLGVDPEELQKQEPGSFHSESSSTTLRTLLEPGRDSTGSQDDTGVGCLISGQGKSRYLENALWSDLRGEFGGTKDILDESSEDDVGDNSLPMTSSIAGGSLLFSSSSASISLGALHPHPAQIFQLWQAYISNINPIVKVFHLPTVQQIISRVSGDLANIPKNEEALLFSIYCISLSSLDETQCNSILGEPKTVLTRRFCCGAQHALINASLLKTSDIMVLQAFTLFLLSLQNHDPRVVWIFTGVAARIGQRIGLHRDGEDLGLPPFETEIRRRLWWQIMMIEGFAEKLAGTGTQFFFGNVKIPRNLNDSDLFPDMKELPREYEGATEMMFFLIRCHVGLFLQRCTRSPASQGCFDGFWNGISTPAVSMDIKDKAIDELDALFQRKFIRYCDHSIPWHFLCVYIAKAVVFMMRFIAHNQPQQYEKSRTSMPQSEKNVLYNLALQVTSYQNMGYTLPEMQCFIWHINMHFQWKAFIYLAGELRTRTHGLEVDEAWRQIQIVYESHPNFSKKLSGRALPVAIGNLTLKAWEAYTTANGVPDQGEPDYIEALRARSASSTEASARSSVPGGNISDNLVGAMYPSQPPADSLHSRKWDVDASNSLEGQLSFSDLPQFDVSQLDWSSWDSLLDEFRLDDSTADFVDASTFDF
ncbi:hypothetical protein BDV95DRAFT_502879 [Massariosphaeria phaeospora]|uniref:Zn(2)-C6 fungal-type domain-containing protein n=1 Tax=Massariosphaeria phaeospora TaxID=100035 RepID=A0A7C8M6N1_9PLEO|nr:hypothetical protein BDV95DRAFT_502879 [Massariosphaeria phaeospora]